MENETKQTNTNEQEPDIFAQKLREADSLYAGCIAAVPLIPGSPLSG